MHYFAVPEWRHSVTRSLTKLLCAVLLLFFLCVVSGGWQCSVRVDNLFVVAAKWNNVRFEREHVESEAAICTRRAFHACSYQRQLLGETCAIFAESFPVLRYNIIMITPSKRLGFVTLGPFTVHTALCCIISASLAIRIAERSGIVIEHSLSPSVRTCVLWQNG